jgi:molybdopterin converting factor small subunit
MATRAEVGGLTGHLNELTGEMHSELVDGDADFGRLRELAQEVAQRAESLAETFGRVDEVLAAELTSDSRGDD